MAGLQEYAGVGRALDFAYKRERGSSAGAAGRIAEDRGEAEIQVEPSDMEGAKRAASGAALPAGRYVARNQRQSAMEQRIVRQRAASHPFATAEA